MNPPMTGLRPIDPRTGEAIINPETGKPFSQAEVERLKAAGMTSPLPQASVPLPQAFEAKTYNQEETLARLGGRTLNEYLNAPPVRTPGISGLKTDPQGRMIPNVGQFQEQPNVGQFQEQPNVAQFQEQPNVAQPPAAALSSFEQASLERQQRIGGTGSFEGDSQAMQDRLRAQGQTTGGQTEGISFDDARIQARGQLAGKGIKDPSVSQVNDLARSIQAGPSSQFQPQVVEVGGQKLIQLAPEYYQQIKPEPKAGEQFVPRQLEYNGFTYVEERPNQFSKQPSTKTGGTTGAVSSIIDETIAVGGGVAAPSEFKIGEIREQDGIKYRFDGKNWNKVA